MWSDASDVLTTSHVSKYENPMRIKLEHARWWMKHTSMMGFCVLSNKDEVLIPLLGRNSKAFKRYNFCSLQKHTREKTSYI